MTEFKSMPSIDHIGKLFMSITQKLHGTNAQIVIKDGKIIAGSRTKYLTPGKATDNFGFAQFVQDHSERLLDMLGEGLHYGEWCGPGINNGEGLESKRLYLFNWRRFCPRDHELFKPHEIIPNLVYTVPVLHVGPVDIGTIETVMNELKVNGSYIANYPHPEGVVIQINNNFYKKVFNVEETQWVRKKERPKIFRPDTDYLLQPLRLEKLLSRDETFLLNYPSTLPFIARAYMTDLIKEGQITGTEDEIKFIQKNASRAIFHFIKDYIAQEIIKP